jgi:hypothetical protein
MSHEGLRGPQVPYGFAFRVQQSWSRGAKVGYGATQKLGADLIGDNLAEMYVCDVISSVSGVGGYDRRFGRPLGTLFPCDDAMLELSVAMSSVLLAFFAELSGTFLSGFLVQVQVCKKMDSGNPGVALHWICKSPGQCVLLKRQLKYIEHSLMAS